MKPILALSLLLAPAAWPQQPDFIARLDGGTMRRIAITDLRGSGDAQKFMEIFNATLWSEIQGAGAFEMAAKSFYPLDLPQRPQDFRAGTNCNGRCLADWAGKPVETSYLAFGYAGVQNNNFVVFGWLYNVTVPDLNGASVLNKFYVGSLDEAGARKTAQQFAADILKQFGIESLTGTRIYYVHQRQQGGPKEIWSMDPDGANKKQITRLNDITINPWVSADGTKLAFNSFAKGRPRIYLYSLESDRFLPFVNADASVNAAPSFSPDGSQVIFSSTFGRSHSNLFLANLDGSNLRPLTSVRAIETEPKINPKTGSEIVFVSGRSGPAQIYRMSIDGADPVRLTSGEGEAVNPCWHPSGQFVAFAWTRGFAPGNYNIFVMDVATREVVQLTHGAGRNENPTWAPDGRHIVFSSNRSGSSQIWTMLANGKDLRQLTSDGFNQQPVWGKQ